MKKLLFPIVAITVTLSACTKTDTTTANFQTQEQSVITDFVNKTAIPQYSDLASKANALQISVDSLHNNPNDNNLQAARLAWKDIRTTWEQCEGFLFGPIEDNSYDPNTDSWPTDYSELDSIRTHNITIGINDVPSLSTSLRGYHPLEFVLFGKAEGRTTADLIQDPVLLDYGVALAGDIYLNNAKLLYEDWAQAPVNFGQKLITHATSDAKFKSKKDVLLAVVGSMSDICGEVGGGKMKEPFDAYDSTGTESPYSNNTLIDFKNNIIGVRNVYLGINGGKGLKDLVRLKNIALDNQLQTAISDAISSFDNITVSYEKAIFDQRLQAQQTMNKIIAVQSLLDNDLTNFITTYVTD